MKMGHEMSDGDVKKPNYIVAVDILCVETIVLALFNRPTDKLIYCRATKLGLCLKKIAAHVLPDLVFSQSFPDTSGASCDDSFNMKRLEFVDREMSKVKMQRVEVLSKLLEVSPEKLSSSFSVYSYPSFFFSSEIIMVGRRENANEIYTRHSVFGTGSHSSYCTLSTYRKFIDWSAIVPRPNHMFDDYFRESNLLKSLVIVFFTSLSVLIRLGFSFLSGRHKKTPARPIFVQGLQSYQSPHLQNDFYWVNDKSILSSVNLITNGNTKLHPDFVDVNVLQIKKFFMIFSFLSALKYRAVSVEYLRSLKTVFKLIVESAVNPSARFFLEQMLSGVLMSSVLLGMKAKVFLTNHSYFNGDFVLACDRANVVYARSTWSNQGQPRQLLKSCADVYFSWGSVTSDIARASGSEAWVKYLEVGCISKNIRNFDVSRRVEVLKPQGCFCILFYDNLAAADLINTPVSLDQAFKVIRDILFKHNDLVVFYKPKSGDDRQLRKSRYYEELKDFLCSGKLHLLMGQRKNSFNASNIAKLFDLVVGYPISTAATEAAISGVRSIHLNFIGATEHPWSRNGNIVVSTPEMAMQRISELITMGKNSKTGKIIGAELEGVDKYQDNMQSRRIQFYIEKIVASEFQLAKDRIRFADQEYEKNIVRLIGASRAAIGTNAT